MKQTPFHATSGVPTHHAHLYMRRPRGRPEGGALTSRDECTCEPKVRVHEERFA